MKKHYTIIVTGRVQGVGYRSFTCHEAKKAGVTGYVKNELDGSVYIEAEGNEKSLDKFVAKTVFISSNSFPCCEHLACAGLFQQKSLMYMGKEDT